MIQGHWCLLSISGQAVGQEGTQSRGAAAARVWGQQAPGSASVPLLLHDLAGKAGGPGVAPPHFLPGFHRLGRSGPGPQGGRGWGHLERMTFCQRGRAPVIPGFRDCPCPRVTPGQSPRVTPALLQIRARTHLKLTETSCENQH